MNAEGQIRKEVQLEREQALQNRERVEKAYSALQAENTVRKHDDICVI